MQLRALLFIAVLMPLLSMAQKKVKYKDLFPLLNSKDYEKSVADLQIFLADGKNSDHANAHLQYGLYFEWRFYNTDVLEDTTRTIQAADSAVIYLQKAKPMIDEKELKKQDEYYMGFFRRDLRTGEFGIKVSDVHLDIEKKVEAIEERLVLYRRLHNNLRSIDNKYNSSAGLYQQLAALAPDYKTFLLRLDEEKIFILETLLNNSAGLYPLIDNAREAAREMEIEKYIEGEVFKPIDHFPEDGVAQTPVYSGTLDLWDYDKWASKAKDDYLGLENFRKKILAVEKQIYNASQSIESGQGAAPIDWKPFLEEDMAYYDPDAVPVRLIRAKIFELEVKKLEAVMNDSTSADSANVVVQLDMAEGLSVNLDSMDNIMQTVKHPEAETMKMHYPEVVNDIYGGPEGLDRFVDKVETAVHEKREKWDAAYARLQERARYAIQEGDSILLESGKVGPRNTLGATGKETRVAYGYNSEIQKGFVVWSGQDRGILNKEDFDLGAINLASFAYDTMPTPSLGFYLYDKELVDVAESKNLILVYTDNRGAIKWSNAIHAKRKPENFRYDMTLEQVTIFFYPEDDLPEGGKELGYMVIDRNGKVR